MPVSPNSVSEEILAALAPLLYNESGSSGPLTVYITGLGQMFQLIESYASDDPDIDAIGYSMWVDLGRAPEEVLPWLGQFVGVANISLNITPEITIATNLVQNPRAEIDLFSIENTGSPITRVSEDSFIGSFSYKCTAVGTAPFNGIVVGAWPNMIPVKPNTKYSVGAMIHPATATELIGANKVILAVGWADSNWNGLSSPGYDFSILSNVWTPVSVDGAVSPANAEWATIYLQNEVGVAIAAGHAFYMSDFIMTESETSFINSYFDGDLSASADRGTRWNGAPHKSSSTLFIPSSLDVKRASLENKVSFMRGTPAALVNAAKATLIGKKRIVLRERFTGDAYKLNVLTFTSETPDAAKTLAALISQKPAGIILTHTVVTGQDYQLLLDNNLTYSAVRTKYATYAGLLADIPGA